MQLRMIEQNAKNSQNIIVPPMRNVISPVAQRIGMKPILALPNNHRP